MSKKHVAYVKPEEPNFLKKLKQEAGYTQGPTVDTKREDYGAVPEDDLQDKEDEKPQVVVLKSGHLTAEEAAQEEDRLRKEKEETPADLSAPIIFKARSKAKSGETVSKRKTESSEEKGKKVKKLKNKALLSFDEEENDD